MIDRVVGALARKRPSPLSSGKDSVWAAAAVHALGRVNFLDDPSGALWPQAVNDTNSD